MRRTLISAGGALALAAIYVRWLRPWQLRWGATDSEVALPGPGDALVEHPHLVATRAVTVNASPEQIWPWLVQIGLGRAGMYSYDWLDNRGKTSAREIIPDLQHLEVGDVVPMKETKPGEDPFGPVVMELDRPRSMLWADQEQPHRLTWLWMLLETGPSQTRLISRLRYRFSWRDPATGILMELADPIMMPKSLRGIAERAEAAAHDRSPG